MARRITKPATPTSVQAVRHTVAIAQTCWIPAANLIQAHVAAVSRLAPR